jgi:hypothetical protein
MVPHNLFHAEDERIWNSSRHDIYIVRSTYYQLTEVIIDNNHFKVEGN